MCYLETALIPHLHWQSSQTKNNLPALINPFTPMHMHRNQLCDYNSKKLMAILCIYC